MQTISKTVVIIPILKKTNFSECQKALWQVDESTASYIVYYSTSSPQQPNQKLLDYYPGDLVTGLTFL